MNCSKCSENKLCKSHKDIFLYGGKNNEDIAYYPKYIKYKEKYNLLKNNNMKGGINPQLMPSTQPYIYRPTSATNIRRAPSASASISRHNSALPPNATQTTSATGLPPPQYIFIMGATGTVGKALVYELAKLNTAKVIYFPIIRQKTNPFTHTNTAAFIQYPNTFKFMDNYTTITHSCLISGELDTEDNLNILLQNLNMLVDAIKDKHPQANITLINTAADKDGTLVRNNLFKTGFNTLKLYMDHAAKNELCANFTIDDSELTDTQKQEIIKHFTLDKISYNNNSFTFKTYKLKFKYNSLKTIKFTLLQDTLEKVLKAHWTIMQCTKLEAFITANKIKLIHLSTVYVNLNKSDEITQYEKANILPAPFKNTLIEEGILISKLNELTSLSPTDKNLFLPNNYIYGWVKAKTEEILSRVSNCTIIRLPGIYDSEYSTALTDTSPGTIFQNILDSINNKLTLDNLQQRYPVNSKVIAQFCWDLITNHTTYATAGPIINFRGLIPMTKFTLATDIINAENLPLKLEPTNPPDFKQFEQVPISENMLLSKSVKNFIELAERTGQDNIPLLKNRMLSSTFNKLFSEQLKLHTEAINAGRKAINAEREANITLQQPTKSKTYI